MPEKKVQVAKSREVANGLGLTGGVPGAETMGRKYGISVHECVLRVIYEKIPEVVTFWHGNMPQQDTTLVFRKMMLEAVVIYGTASC